LWCGGGRVVVKKWNSDMTKLIVQSAELQTVQFGWVTGNRNWNRRPLASVVSHGKKQQ